MNQTIGNAPGGWMGNTLFLMPNWKWFGILIAIAAGFLVASLLKKALFKLKTSPVFRGKTEGFFKHYLNTDLQSPIAWIVTATVWIVCLDGLALPPGLDKYLKLIAQVVLALNAIILAYRAVEAVGRVFQDYAANTESKLDDQLAPMATKVLKVLVIALGVLISLRNFGFDVLPALAGLGLGGLALALAAQDTAANVFGSVTILADRPFNIGDWIKVGETEGTVEEIGIRSTRVRTFTGSLVAVPNSIIAKERVENIGIRYRARIRHTIGVTYETSLDQIQAYMDTIELYLKSHPHIESDYVVRLTGMGDFALQILVNFYARTTEVKDVDIQQEFLFFAMRTAEQMKIDFAYPTATHILKTAEETKPKAIQ